MAKQKNASPSTNKSSEKPRMTTGKMAKGDSRSKTMTGDIKPSKGC
jgi:hypothetical protein